MFKRSQCYYLNSAPHVPPITTWDTKAMVLRTTVDKFRFIKHHEFNSETQVKVKMSINLRVKASSDINSW